MYRFKDAALPSIAQAPTSPGVVTTPNTDTSFNSQNFIECRHITTKPFLLRAVGS